MSKFALLTAVAGLAQAYTNTDVGQFMMKNIDPIVMPGEYKSHMHSFFGSDAVTKDLPTSEQLRAGCATAKNPNDFSVYWVPTLYHVHPTTGERTAIKPKRFTAYYQFEKESAEVPIPEDFNVLAGNTAATTAADVDNNGSKLAWLCEGEKFDAGGKSWSDFPKSTCSKSLQTAFFFPDCVNEETLESAYSSGGKCADGMKIMPQLRFSVRYDVKSVASEGWDGDAPFELACGPSHCMHGDFINGWDKETLKTMVTALTKPRSFQSLDGPHGTTKAGSICTTTAKDQDPSNGTDDYENSLEMMNGGNSTTPTTPTTPATSTSATPIASDAPAESASPIESSAPSATEETEASENCLSTRSIGSKSKRAAYRRALREALEKLEEME